MGVGSGIAERFGGREGGGGEEDKKRRRQGLARGFVIKGRGFCGKIAGPRGRRGHRFKTRIRPGSLHASIHKTSRLGACLAPAPRVNATGAADLMQERELMLFYARRPGSEQQKCGRRPPETCWEASGKLPVACPSFKNKAVGRPILTDRLA